MSLSVWVRAQACGSALSGPPEISHEPILSVGPTVLVTGLYLIGGPITCPPGPAVSSAGTVTVTDSTTKVVVATQAVARGALATIPLPPGTYVIGGTFRNAFINGLPWPAIPALVVVQDGYSVRQDVIGNVP